jgi:hypothetical protein
MTTSYLLNLEIIRLLSKFTFNFVFVFYYYVSLNAYSQKHLRIFSNPYTVILQKCKLKNAISCGNYYQQKDLYLLFSMNLR